MDLSAGETPKTTKGKQDTMNEVSSAVVKAYAIARSRWNALGNDAKYLNEMNRLQQVADIIWAGYDADLDKAADAFIASHQD